jgi:hypothetical protein
MYNYFAENTIGKKLQIRQLLITQYYACVNFRLPFSDENVGFYDFNLKRNV